MFRSVPSGRSCLGGGTVTRPGRPGCLNCWWLPLVRTNRQPSAFSRSITSRLLMDVLSILCILCQRNLKVGPGHVFAPVLPPSTRSTVFPFSARFRAITVDRRHRRQDKSADSSTASAAWPLKYLMNAALTAGLGSTTPGRSSPSSARSCWCASRRSNTDSRSCSIAASISASVERLHLHGGCAVSYRATSPDSRCCALSVRARMPPLTLTAAHGT